MGKTTKLILLDSLLQEKRFSEFIVLKVKYR